MNVIKNYHFLTSASNHPLIFLKSPKVHKPISFHKINFWVLFIKGVSRTVEIPLRSKTGDITYGWPLAAVHSNAHDWWHEKHSLMETLVHLRKMNRTLCILLTVLWLKPWESRLSSSMRRSATTRLYSGGGGGTVVTAAQYTLAF